MDKEIKFILKAILLTDLVILVMAITYYLPNVMRL